MKKLLTWILISLMAFTPCLSAMAEEAEIDEEAVTVEEPQPLDYDYDELVVGTQMPMYGAFSFDLFGNGSSDIDVRMLLHGYNLIEWQEDVGGFRLDPSVVSGSVIGADNGGDHIYELSLYHDLYYSDGTPITAWDYAFSWLLRIAPEIGEIGGTPLQADYLAGYSAYVNGRQSYLSGVHVINDYQIEIVLDRAYLPFFYEVGLLDCVPYPIQVIAPGCEVADDGLGVYIRNIPVEGVNAQEPIFTAELLKDTILNGETGYLTYPSVVSGPYEMLSFDGTEAKFQLNPYYKGNSEGVKPTIAQITYKTANSETMIDELLAGEYGLLNKVARPELVTDGMTKAAEDGRYSSTTYPRTGLSFLAFNRERTAVNETAVRQAIALCLDREGLTEAYLGNFGLAVSGFYGLGQWMFQIVNGTIAYPVDEKRIREKGEMTVEEELAAWEALTLDEIEGYNYNVEEAIRLLEADGWTLNREGEAYDAAKDDARCKEINGEIVALELKLVYPETTPIGDALETYLAAHAKEAGIRMTVEAADNVLPMYYGDVERDYDLVFLATNFVIMFDPSALMDPNGASNFSGNTDQELYDLLQEMRGTESGDLLSYCQKWVQFLERFGEVEPMIPVYTNVYTDFYPITLKEYSIAENMTWSTAIIPAVFDETLPEEESEEEGMDELTEFD